MTVTNRRPSYALGNASPPSVTTPAAVVTDSPPPADADGPTRARTDGARPVVTALAGPEGEG